MGAFEWGKPVVPGMTAWFVHAPEGEKYHQPSNSLADVHGYLTAEAAKRAALSYELSEVTWEDLVKRGYYVFPAALVRTDGGHEVESYYEEK